MTLSQWKALPPTERDEYLAHDLRQQRTLDALVESLAKKKSYTPEAAVAVMLRRL